jgi:hypothetical protein
MRHGLIARSTRHKRQVSGFGARFNLFLCARDGILLAAVKDFLYKTSFYRVGQG